MKAHRLLNIDRGDYPKLGVLAPSFTITAACTVILASLSKALFLASNPIRLLPWMFLGAAAITVLTSLGYVALMRAMSIGARFTLLVVIAIGSLVALRVAYPTRPALVGVIILLWCPAIGHLLVVQIWNVASSLLPTRQGKRLFPVLAAVTTLGAVLGGLTVQIMVRWLGAEDLLVVAAGLLLYPLAMIGRVIRKLTGDDTKADTQRKPREPGSEIAKGFRSIIKQPLLSELALLAFLLQAASLVLDYQFSAEIQPQFDKDGIARFLGTFYWSSNLLVLGLTLFATSRLVRAVGIGIALAASAIVVGIGSGAYAVVALTGAASTFWVIAATAFAERIAEYAFTKPAVQMVYMPLQTRGGERAKTIIDGVIHRFATAAVSVVLVLVAPDLASQFRLSFPAVVACALVLYLGIRLGPHYRQALFEALRARRLDATSAAYLRDGLGAQASTRLETQLRSGNRKRMLRALEVARELAMPLPEDRVDELALHDDPKMARAALMAMEASGRRPSWALLERMLKPNRASSVLRSILGVLGERELEPEVAELIRPLARHSDSAIAAAACVLRIRAENDGQTVDASAFTGISVARAFADELPELAADPQSPVRKAAIKQMGELALTRFVPPLVACLNRSSDRADGIGALAAFGSKVVPAISSQLEDDALTLASRVAILKAIERIGTKESVNALTQVCRSRNRILRDHAVEALWRIAADATAVRPTDDVLRELVEREVEQLRVYSAIEVMLTDQLSTERALFAEELVAQQTRAERRVFRLLGILREREAMLRAYLHYKSDEPRARSNAIELLEQHVTDPGLRPFVALIEREEDDQGELRPRTIVIQKLLDGGDIDQLVGRDPWLARLWDWKDQEVFEKLLVIKKLPFFTEIGLQELLPLTRALEEQRIAAGQRLFAKGDPAEDVFWLAEGRMMLSSTQQPDQPLAVHDCFGAASIIDGKPRSATATAVDDALVLKVARSRFEDAIELSPKILRRVIELLTRRLRAATP